MLATVVVAVALAGIRLLPSIDWTAWAIATVSIAGLSLVILPPAMQIILRVKDTAHALFSWIIYVAIAWLCALAIVSLIGPRMRVEFVVALTVICITVGALIGVPLFAVRAAGYRLIIRRHARRDNRSAVSGDS
jgi:hypothetical protein